MAVNTQQSSLSKTKINITGIKSRTLLVAKFLFNSYTENPSLVQTDIARARIGILIKHRVVTVAFVEPLPSLILSDYQVRGFLRSFDSLNGAIKTPLDAQNNYLSML
ncbi:hypothetical protein [Microcoleus sp. herbarium14]|uniref:hypothetical protein n=1 Tax=Microcoleus sp. herbarium14 TaxID=3055439 RepID=UPI002FD0E45D